MQGIHKVIIQFLFSLFDGISSIVVDDWQTTNFKVRDKFDLFSIHKRNVQDNAYKILEQVIDFS